jgi:hypothetical protein
MEKAEKHLQQLKTFDLPPEVGEYIKVLESKLESTLPRREELVNKGLDKLTNQEIDELTNLNFEAVKILGLIRKSRDEKKIVEDKEETIDLEDQYKATLDHLREKLGFSPEKEIQTYDIEIGGKTKDELIQEMEEKNISFSSWAKDIMNKSSFTTSLETKNLKLVRLTVAEIGFPDGARTKEIYKKADELGLDLCPAEVGSQLRLQYDIKEWTLIAMNQISDSSGSPRVFNLNSDDGQLGLNTYDAEPGRKWNSDVFWVFSFRKLAS